MQSRDEALCKSVKDMVSTTSVTKLQHTVRLDRASLDGEAGKA